MNFQSHIPFGEVEPEALDSYASDFVIDCGGIDLKTAQGTFSASFQELDVVDVALAVLQEDFQGEEERARNVLKLGTLDTDALERLGYVYLRAAQIKREAKEQKRVAALEPALV